MSAGVKTSDTTFFFTGALFVTLANALFVYPHEIIPDRNSVANLTNITISEEERRQYLAELQRKTTMEMSVALVFLAILSVVGLVGNSLVIFVYSRKFHWTATGLHIMTIASLDLVANIVAIPGEMYNMLHKWDFNNPALCRARVYISAFCTSAAAMCLVALAVVRYRRVCHPHSWQITPENSKAIVSIITTVGAFISVPHAILNGRHIIETKRKGIVGYSCGTDEKYRHSKLLFYTYVLLLLMYIISAVTLIVLYSLIGLTARRRRHVYAMARAIAVPCSALTSRFESKVHEHADDHNQSNCIVCGGRKNENLETLISSVSAFQNTSNVGDSKVNRFRVGNENNEVHVPYRVRVFTDRIEVRTAMVEWFFVKLLKTNPVLAELAGCKESSASETAATHNDTENTLPAKASFMHAKSILNINQTDNDRYDSNSIKTAPNEAVIESDPLTKFKLLDVVYCPEDQHSAFCSNCTPKESISFSLPLSNNLLQKTDWLKTSVKQAMSQEDELSEKKPSISLTRRSSLTKKIDTGGTCDARPTDQKTTETGISLQNTNFPQPEMNTEVSRVSGHSTADTDVCKRPSGRTTTVLFTISAFYILSYLPNLALIFVKLLAPSVITSASSVTCIFYNLLSRSYFVNSAVNPIIYSLCDGNFRRECLRIFRKSPNVDI